MSVSSISVSSKKKLKIVFLGNQNVGKTCIINKYVHDKFDQKETPTIGIDFLVANLIHNKKNYRLQLWDTAGQERFKSLIPSYLKDSHCAIIVYDVTNKQSFEDAFIWVDLYMQHMTSGAFCILVGNKIDLQKRFQGHQLAKSKCLNHKLDYYEISAKTSQNLKELFQKVIDNVNKRQQQFIQNGDISLPEALKQNGQQSIKAFCTPRTKKSSQKKLKLSEQKQQQKQKRKKCC